MSQSLDRLVADSLDIWTSATLRKSGAGRGGSKRISLYGIERLRALILDLAVRGKLVPQNAGDEPTRELLNRIARSQTSIRQRRKPAAGDMQEVSPTGLPIGWKLARLDDIANPQAGFAFKSKGFNEIGVGLPLIRIRDVGQPFTGTFYDGEHRDEFVVDAGDYLISMDGEFRVAAWQNGAALLNQRVTRLQFFGEELERPLVAIALQLELTKLQGVKAYTTVDHLSGKQIAEALIPLPPLAEQRRIVAKVDELMALCDGLERESADAMAAHTHLVEELLATLVNSADAADLAANWARLANHFDILFTADASVEALKQAILDLAVRGKLSDRKDWPLRPVDLKSVAKLQNGYAFKSEWFVGEGVRLLRNINVSHGHANWDEAAYLSDEMAAEYDRFRLEEGDVVLTLDRPFISTGTKVANITSSDLPALLLQRVGRFQLSASICPDYLYLWVNSPLFSEQIDPGRSNGVPHISSKQVEAAAIYVPKVAEQHRIVAKVNDLMALCDALKARLAEAAQTRCHLADAITERAAV